MKKSTPKPLIVGIVVLLGLIIYFALYQAQNFNWNAEYTEDGTAPYDLKVLKEVLDDRYDVSDFDKRVEEEIIIKGNDITATTYLYIGNQPCYTENEAWHLKKYVMAGGTAMIITNHIPDSLAQFLLYAEDCGSFSSWNGRSNYEYVEKVFSHFTHPSINKEFYNFEYRYSHVTAENSWHYIPKDAFCGNEEREYPIVNLGEFDVDGEKKEFTNFIKMKVGEGYFFFHTNPIMFSNYYMIDSAGFEYANNVFSHIDITKLYWDKESEKYPNNKKGTRTRPTTPAQSPLDYIFSQSSLRLSWYLFLSIGLLYVLFRAKRKQRKIPILENNRNTSLEFVETIGTLYFQQQDHKGIVRKQMELFLAHLRQRYHLVTRDLDDKLIDRVAVRARVEKKIVKDIFKEYFRLKKYLYKSSGKISVDVLTNFYLLIERFHQAEKKNKFNK